MRYASVCDGIGAVHVAWQPLGWHCEWTAEIDAFPAAVVEQRWGFPNRGDMTRFKEWDDAPIDLLVGGTPCQSFSVAGLRKGLHDPRGGLMLTFLEIAQRYRPRWVVWENVPGVLSSNGGRDFGAFLGALGELGYGWAYRVLDAQWFGVAQRRRRVFVVGCFGDERRAAQVLFESESVRRDNPPSRAKGQGATYDVAPCIGASGRGFERAGETRGQDPVVAQPIWRGGDQANSEHCYDHAGTLNCDKGQQGGIVDFPDPSYAISAGAQGNGGVFGSGRDSQDTFVTQPVSFHPTQDPISSEDGVVHALGTGSSGGCATAAVAFKPSHFTRGKDGAPSDVTPPLSADADKGDQDTVIATPFTKSKRAQSTTDDESWVPGEVAPTFNCFDQGDTRATTVVAYDVLGTPATNAAKETDVHVPLRARKPGQSEASTTTVVACNNTGPGWWNEPEQVAATVRSECDRTSVMATAVLHKAIGFDGIQSDNPKATHQATIEGTGPLIRGRPHCFATALAVRRLTPRECERLQGFPDDYTAIEYRNKPAADGPRYKALGNSMAVPVMAWIGRRIAAASQK